MLSVLIGRDAFLKGHRLYIDRNDGTAARVDDFLAAAAGRPVQRLATGEDGLRALEVALAAYRSVDSGSLEAV